MSPNLARRRASAGSTGDRHTCASGSVYLTVQAELIPTTITGSVSKTCNQLPKRNHAYLNEGCLRSVSSAKSVSRWCRARTFFHSGCRSLFAVSCYLVRSLHEVKDR